MMLIINIINIINNIINITNEADAEKQDEDKDVLFKGGKLFKH